MRAGAAQVEITPRAGTQLSGHIGTYRPARFVRDPLFAKALVLESGGRMLCFLALDVTIVTRPYTEQIRKRAHEAFGLDPNAIMVHATQTHSAPALGGFMLDPDFELEPQHEWLRGQDESFNRATIDGCIDAIRKAIESLVSVQVGVGSGIEGRLAFNRRAVLRNGSVGMPGRVWPDSLGPVNIRYLEGPIDPELGVVCFREDTLAVPAMLFSYTCHPVHVFPSLDVSADWPGALCAEAVQRHGSRCVPLVLNGACGNINPWPPYDPDYVEDHRQMGREMYRTVERVLASLEFECTDHLDWAVSRIKIPFRDLDPNEVRAARKRMEEAPKPAWVNDRETAVDADWMRSAMFYGLTLQIEREKKLEYEIQAFRVGDTAFVGLPGEPFVEGQLQIKLASPAHFTYVVHCTTQYIGYIPIPEAIPRGGHEARTSYWSKLAPEALDLVVNGAVETLKKLF